MFEKLAFCGFVDGLRKLGHERKGNSEYYLELLEKHALWDQVAKNIKRIGVPIYKGGKALGNPALQTVGRAITKNPGAVAAGLGGAAAGAALMSSRGN